MFAADASEVSNANLVFVNNKVSPPLSVKFVDAISKPEDTFRIKLSVSFCKLKCPLPLKNIPVVVNEATVPSAILPPPSVDISSLGVSRLKVSVTIAIVLEPSNVILFPLAAPALNSPLVFIKIPVPVPSAAVDELEVSKANFVVFSNNVLPPANVKFWDLISKVLPFNLIKLLASF